MEKECKKRYIFLRRGEKLFIIAIIPKPQAKLLQKRKLTDLLQSIGSVLFVHIKGYALLTRGIVEINVVLVWAKRVLPYQLGHEDLLIDLSAHLNIAAPFPTLCIIRGSSR